MKDLLEKDFMKHYSVVRTSSVHTATYNADFALKDEKACIACAKIGKDVACKIHEVVKFGCKEKTATVIDYEGFINSLAGTDVGEGKKCDNILYTSDKDKFVLNELTCSQAKYIEPYATREEDQLGKRATAMVQFNQTIDKLCAVPAIDTFIQSFNQTVGLFAYRLKPMPTGTDSNNNQGVQGMQQFLQPLTATPAIQIPKGLNKEFAFVQVLYPNTYDL